jgi:predicted ATPase
MATGHKPFLAKNRVLTMDAILNAHPATPSKANPMLPAALDPIMARVLEKNRQKRFQHAAEVCSELKRLKREMEKVPTSVAAGAPMKPPPPIAGYGSILARGLASIRARFSEKPSDPMGTRLTNLPVQQTRFVGREREVAAAKELLRRPDVYLVTVTGPGGIGKTRLAVEVAACLLDNFPGGTYFVSLFLLSDPSLIASVIVQALGIREGAGQSPLEILKQNLQDSSRGPVLLVLDNLEQLVQAGPTLGELLAAGSNLKLIVTSRSPLHIYGEHEFPVPPLALPDPRSLPPIHALSQYSGIALFVARAVAAKPDFELTRENSSEVTEICVRLDGLPLAIELAAARVKVLSLASMQTRLASRLQLLTGGARNLPQRQQTLRGAIDWSYDLLNPAEQRLFRRLSVFAGGCSLEGAEAVGDAKGDLDLDLLEGMASLVDKSLVQRAEPANGESRFVMLQTIREYSLEKLEASGEGALTKRALAAYCLVLAEEETAEQSGGEAAEWLERFTLEHDNFRAALDWLIETGESEWGLRLGAALFRFWEMREFLAEGRSRLGKLLNLPRAAAPTKARARALFAAGVLAVDQGDFPSADVLIRESLEIMRQLGDKQGTAVSLNALAVNARDIGDVPVARALFEESLLRWREVGDQKAIARSLSNLANVVKLQGDYAQARSLYAECLSMFEELGDRIGVAWSMNYQGDVARDQGDSAAAQTLYEQALAIFRDLDDRWGVAGTLADLGSLSREQGNYSRARSLYQESIKIFQELGHKRGIARLLECFAYAAAGKLEAERALRLAGAAAALRQNIGAPLKPAEQIKLEAALETPRQVLSRTACHTAWSEGLAMPVEQAIEEVLKFETTPSSC